MIWSKKPGLFAALAGILGAGLMAGAFALQSGCSKPANPMGPTSGGTQKSGTPTITPTPGGAPANTPTETPTPGPTPIVITAVPGGANFLFNPSSITVASGTQVTFNTPGHTVDIDNGQSDGVCGTPDFTSFSPAPSFTFSGTSGMVYHIHCDIHSSCGAGTCSGCTGMVMTVTIQ